MRGPKKFGDAMAGKFPQITWPRLSETLPHQHPGQCGNCGAIHAANIVVWQEHDDQDHPEIRYVALCEPCEEAIIEPHPRLYRRLPRHAPAPGIMPLCVDCNHRAGTLCKSPEALFNGGTGMATFGPEPTIMFFDYRDKAGRRQGEPRRIYPGPVTECTGRDTDHE